jgi:hypothetical protein
MTKTITQSMKQALLVAAMAFGCYTAQAQNFTQMSQYDTLFVDGDTVNLNILAPAANAWGTATVTVYFGGSFGNQDAALEVFGGTSASLGFTPPATGNTCINDSVTFTFPASQLAAWTVNDTLKFRAIASNEVNPGNCEMNRVRLKITYNYCVEPTTGPFAELTLSETTFCASDEAASIVALPAGGTFSGQGLSAAGFNPQGLLPGAHTVRYTYTNADGCTSFYEVPVQIRYGAVINASEDTVCYGETVELNTSMQSVTWYSDIALTDSIGAGNTFTTPAIVNGTTSFYATQVLDGPYFTLDTIATSDSLVVDHNDITGDDRGGIAVTTEYIYMVGDEATVRYDLNLENGIGLPRMDGLFSDLATGQLYTLYNAVTGAPDYDANDHAYATQIRSLNADLTWGTEVITLSDSVYFGYDQSGDRMSGIFAGTGFVMIHSAQDFSSYVISLQDGNVTNLGQTNIYAEDGTQPETSENFAFWGVAEFTENGYAMLYAGDDNTSIIRRTLPDGEPEVAFQFEDLNDLASFTYAPWNNRFYMHYEGGGQFDPQGEMSEILISVPAADSTGNTLRIPFGCPAEIVLTSEVIVTDIVTIETACIDEEQQEIVITTPGGILTGAGTTVSGTEAYFDPAVAGAGVHTIVYSYTSPLLGCVYTDTAIVTVNGLPAVSITSTSAPLCIGDAAVALTATPAGGSFGGTGVEVQSFNPTTAGLGTHEVTYTYTDANGCTNAADVTYDVNCTLGIDQLTTATISIYPNPAANSMFVELGEFNAPAVFTVFDAAGRLVITQQSNGQAAQEINVSTLVNGTYILHVNGAINSHKIFMIAQ